MADAPHLWLYFLILFGVVALPGLDMAFVMTSTLAGNHRSGLAAVGGIVAGGVCHIVMGALGVAVILTLWPGLYNAMLVAGAGYIAWIGWTILRSRQAFQVHCAHAGRRIRRVFLQALGTSLVNPKAYVFMLAVFPQFIVVGSPVWPQALVLGAITAFTQATTYGAVVFCAAGVRRRLAADQTISVLATRAVGGILIVAGFATVAQGLRVA
jgi:threonine/homoserine/homoserine lactone efflux protein